MTSRIEHGNSTTITRCALCKLLVDTVNDQIGDDEPDMTKQSKSHWVHWTTGDWSDEGTTDNRRVSLLYAIVSTSARPALSMADADVTSTCLFAVAADDGKCDVCVLSNFSAGTNLGA